jgi:hypothetical protein
MLRIGFARPTLPARGRETEGAESNGASRYRSEAAEPGFIVAFWWIVRFWPRRRFLASVMRGLNPRILLE